MRLWSEELIKILPRMQLQGMIREIPAMRGNGWGKKHSTVDYVFENKREKLVAFHQLVIKEFEERGYNPNPIWKDFSYRGKNCEKDYSVNKTLVYELLSQKENIYNEHNEEYLQECIDNLKDKGVVCKYLENNEVIE